MMLRTVTDLALGKIIWSVNRKHCYGILSKKFETSKIDGSKVLIQMLNYMWMKTERHTINIWLRNTEN